jgi:hypothetical protein
MARNIQPSAPPVSGPQPTPFSRQDAENIIVIARRSPLQNLEEAEVLSAALQRFAVYVTANVK